MTSTKESQEPASPRRFTLARFLFQALSLAVIMAASLGCYLLVLYWRGPHAQFVTYTAWDELVPFHPAWIWMYLIPYLVGPIVAGLLTRETFRWYVQRGLVIVGITLLIFILVPTQTMPRLHVVPGDGLTGLIYNQVAAIDDPPANAAPSLHVSLTCLLALAVIRDFPRWWLPTVISVGLVWLATLGTRQHHLIDVATGVALACLVAWLFPRNRVTA